MTTINRRTLLAGSAGLALTAALAACSDGDAGSDDSDAAIQWWDHFTPLRELQKATFAKFEASPGGEHVEFTSLNPEKMGEALQLAKSANNLPDVSSLAGLAVPVPALIEAGWCQPITLTDETMEQLKDDLFEGIHIFDGELYSFPLFSFRQYTSALWFNTDLAERAELDPGEPPTTYEEFRAAAAAVQALPNADAYGFLWNAGAPSRVRDQTNDLAQAAGFEGYDGMSYRTGEYAYDSDPYLQVIEFLQSLQQDGLLRPGSTNWDGATAKSHWVSGEACFYFDGPWLPGAALQNDPDFGDRLGVGSILVPENDMAPASYHVQTGGSFWLSKSSQKAEAVNTLFSNFLLTDDYTKGIANGMDQPPRDLSVVEDSSAHDAYKELINRFQNEAFLAPNPMVRNADVAEVQSELHGVTPTLGDIVQGALTGDVSDVKGALKTLSDEMSRDRDRAIEAARQRGASVDLEDFAFANWTPRTDFTSDKY